jgi:hypothetical protein
LITALQTVLDITILIDYNMINNVLQWGVPIHEIGHTIGLFHEQSRPDRDSYVTVYFNNMLASDFSQFEKKDYTNIQTYNFSYDYGSIMHYGSKVSGQLISFLAPFNLMRSL